MATFFSRAARVEHRLREGVVRVAGSIFTMFRNAFDGTDELTSGSGSKVCQRSTGKDQASHKRNFLHFCKIVMVMLD